MKITRIISLVLVLAVALTPAVSEAKKKKDKKNDRQQVQVDETENMPNKVHIKDAAKQLYGEWNVVEINKQPYSGSERPYIYLDFSSGKNRLMGSLGTNAVNGTFTVKGEKLSFANLITTDRDATSASTERAILKALQDAHGVILTRLEPTEYLTITDKHNHQILKLRRQNIDFLNGGWKVKELNGENVENRNIKLVADVEMLTINADSGCNIINGVININPTKEFAVEFEDLVSTHYDCPNLSTETRMLIALEETASCKRLNDNETALLDRNGKTLIVLKRLNVSQLKK